MSLSSLALPIHDPISAFVYILIPGILLNFTFKKLKKDSKDSKNDLLDSAFLILIFGLIFYVLTSITFDVAILLSSLLGTQGEYIKSTSLEKHILGFMNIIISIAVSVMLLALNKITDLDKEHFITKFFSKVYLWNNAVGLILLIVAVALFALIISTFSLLFLPFDMFVGTGPTPILVKTVCDDLISLNLTIINYFEAPMILDVYSNPDDFTSSKISNQTIFSNIEIDSKKVFHESVVLDEKPDFLYVESNYWSYPVEVVCNSTTRSMSLGFY